MKQKTELDSFVSVSRHLASLLFLFLPLFFVIRNNHSFPLSHWLFLSFLSFFFVSTTPLIHVHGQIPVYKYKSIHAYIPTAENGGSTTPASRQLFSQLMMTIMISKTFLAIQRNFLVSPADVTAAKTRLQVSKEFLQ